MPLNRRLKVLVSAYACSPVRGSEAGVGWGWLRCIAQGHDVHALVGERYREEIEAFLQDHPDDPCSLVSFHFIRHEWSPRLNRVWPPYYLWTYKRWQRKAYELGRKLHEEIQFDLVHQLTYVGFRVPGYLWKLDVPFVWGPIGGLENTPWRLLPLMGSRGAIYYGARNVINSCHKRFLALPKRAFEKADGSSIAATGAIKREIAQFYGKDSHVICEIGTPEGVPAAHSVRKPDEPLQIAWSGQHLPGKALPLLLHALAGLPEEVAWRLDILGDGSCRKQWQRLAGRLGLQGRCVWHGQLPRSEAVMLVHNSHVFVITSMKDLTSSVLLEALSQGVPVICPDHCGFSDVVTDGCGIKFPATRAKVMQQNIARAVQHLWEDESHRQVLARGARERSSEFTWQTKKWAILRLYDEAAERGMYGVTKIQ